MENSFTVLNRSSQILNNHETEFDLIIIGGGVTGCGIALDATVRGLKTLLVEKTDFAAGTSSKSTKLIHGGLRYLKQLEIGLVRETGMERAILHKLAPHLVHPEKMLLPIVENGTFNKWTASLAISVYDFLARVPKGDRKNILTKTQTLNEEPLLNNEILKSGIQYAEYRTDDARLTIELIKKAVSMGCNAYNYTEVTNMLYNEHGTIKGVKCHDQILDREVAYKAKSVVSAAGPWVDTLRDKDNSKTGKTLRLTKGVHIVVPKSKLNIKHAVYFDAFDGRMIFAIPRGKTTYIGTSDTDYIDNLNNVLCNFNDVIYILDATNHVFPEARLVVNDVVSSWAGLRPLIQELGKSPSDVSRKDEIFVSPSGLISIAGGKLTGYRMMARRVVSLVCKLQNEKRPRAKTRKIKLTNNPFDSYQSVQDFIQSLSKVIGFDLSWYLTTVYGRAATEIMSNANCDSSNLTLRQKILLSEIDYTIKYESVWNPLDFFNRRTGNLYFDIELVKSELELTLNHFEKVCQWTTNNKNYWRLETLTAINDVSTFDR
jgi:glycerol-3-phosphate dehydrogenase